MLLVILYKAMRLSFILKSLSNLLLLHLLLLTLTTMTMPMFYQSKSQGSTELSPVLKYTMKLANNSLQTQIVKDFIVQGML